MAADGVDIANNHSGDKTTDSLIPDLITSASGGAVAGGAVSTDANFIGNVGGQWATGQKATWGQDLQDAAVSAVVGTGISTAGGNAVEAHRQALGGIHPCQNLESGLLTQHMPRGGEAESGAGGEDREGCAGRRRW